MGEEIKTGAREVSWVPVARLGLTLPSPARHGGCKKRRQPPRRLPSPWTEAVDFLCFPQSRARQCTTFLLARAARSRKSTASVQGEGKRAWRARVRAVATVLLCVRRLLSSLRARPPLQVPLPFREGVRG